MERKYYLRGLGIGIAVTAIIMGIAQSGGRTMTDKEIIARAKELGMVENTVLSDTIDENTEKENIDENAAGDSAVKDQSQDKTPQDSANVDGAVQTAGDNVSVDETDAQKDTDDAEAENGADRPDDVDATPDSTEDVETETESEEEEEPADTHEIITSAAIKTITVNSGDGSYTVAKKLADVGVVTSAETFDTFLCQNGYDKRLRTGTFSIPADASDEQIARIVTGAE